MTMGHSCISASSLIGRCSQCKVAEVGETCWLLSERTAKQFASLGGTSMNLREMVGRKSGSNGNRGMFRRNFWG
jgi:hypothetical protein